MLLRLFNDDSPLIDHNVLRKKAQEQASANERQQALSSAEPADEKLDDPQVADGSATANFAN